MRPLHERFLAEIAAERRRLSRRRLLGASAALGGGALALGAAPGFGLARAWAQGDATPEAVAFADDVDVLNFALTLEHLENAFYRDGLPLFPALGADNAFGQDVAANLAAISAHEAAHVATLTDVILSLGGEPVAEQAYLFDDAYADEDAFLETAQALENVGVGAYNGAGQFIEDGALLTAAGTIVAVEARHAAYLNLVTDAASPFPAAFDAASTPDEVLAAAGPFIASA